MVTQSPPPPSLTDSEDEYEVIDDSISTNSKNVPESHGNKTNEMIARIQEVVHERRERREQKESTGLTFLSESNANIAVRTFICTVILSSILHHSLYAPDIFRPLQHLMKFRDTSSPLRTITLPASSGKLGFTLGSVWISDVVEGGLADQYSDLRIGDQIISVNDVTVDGLGERQIIDLIVEAKTTGIVRLVLRHDESESLRELLQNHHFAAAARAAKQSEIDGLTRKLEQAEKSLQFVMKHYKKQLAERDASIETCTKRIDELMAESSLLKKTTDKKKLMESTAPRRDVSLPATPDQLGFSLRMVVSRVEQGAADDDFTGFTMKNLWVSAVAEGELAAQHSDLRVGDKIISINGATVEWLRMDTLVLMIKDRRKTGMKLVVQSDMKGLESVDDQDELEGGKLFKWNI